MAVDGNMPILIVDDYKTMPHIIRNCLGRLSFTNIHEATDGESKPIGADHDPLNGPQLPGEGNRQEDIDALLASFD